MGGGAALFEHDAAQLGAVVFEQFRRPHIAGDEDGIIGQIAPEALVVAGQHAQQPVGEIVEIMQPVADIGIGLAHHAGAGVVLHPLDRRFGRKPVLDRLGQPVHPAAVIGEHAVGFEDFAVIGGRLHVAMVEHGVDRDAHALQRIVEPRFFLLGILGDEIGDDDARVVQHHRAKRDAIGEADAGKHARPPEVDIRTRLDEIIEVGGGDHFGQDCGRSQHRFGFVLAIMPPLGILHDEHAKRLAGPQNRHAEEGVIGIFAGFRAIGEGGMGWARRRGCSGSASAAMRPTRPSPSRSVVMCTDSALRPLVANSSSAPSSRST